MELFISAIFLLAIALFIYALASYASSKKQIRRIESKLNNLHSSTQPENPIESLKLLNRSYMLNISDYVLVEIAKSTDPIKALREKVVPGYPSEQDFFENMDKTFSYLFDEMRLTEEQQEEVAFTFLNDFMPSVTDDMLKQIAHRFGSNAPPKMSFLKDKINYELAALGVIMTVGNHYNDFNLKSKVQNIRKKRGYM